MTTEIRIHRQLYDRALLDLRRSHPFAHERVGFLIGRLCAPRSDQRLILLHDYNAVADEHYLRDNTVGASIGEEAMASAMKVVFDGRASCDGVFHVHLHDHRGPTGMSHVDERELPPMLPGFAGMGKTAAHGIVILSTDHGTAWVYSPGERQIVEAARLVVTGAPLVIFEKGRRW